MRDRCFILAALLSLVVAVATAALCGASYCGVVLIWWCTGRHLQSVALSKGEIIFESMKFAARERSGVQCALDPPRNSVEEFRNSAKSWHGVGGFYFFKRVNPIWAAPSDGFLVPFWLFAPPFTILPAIAYRRARRNREGQCVYCGYDLRATPERCPECGVVADKSAACGSRKVL